MRFTRYEIHHEKQNHLKRVDIILQTKKKQMKSSEFIGKFKSRYLWLNILGMIAVVLICIFGLKYGLAIYTHHGEAITVPHLKFKSYQEAEAQLKRLGLELQVVDTGYIKTLPADCVLEQTPKGGERVKSGRIIYITINSSKSPTITLPDVIDNSSLREAMAKLQSMGFKLTAPKQVPGEKDWVYGIMVGDKNVVAGEKIPVDKPLTIMVGNGMRSASDSVSYVEPTYRNNNSSGNDVDDFEEVPAPGE